MLVRAAAVTCAQFPYLWYRAMALESKRIGRSDIEIPPIVFGGNVFGWGADEATSFDLLDALMERGFNCVDTADIYSMWVDGHEGGESETIIGKWLKAKG